MRVHGELLSETLYSDALLQFLLKTWDRKTYGDQVKIDLRNESTDRLSQFRGQLQLSSK